MAVYRETLEDKIRLDDDIEALDIAEFTQLLFKRTCQAVRDGQRIPTEAAALFEQHATEFDESLQVILAIEHDRTRNAALRAAMAALSIGYFHAGSPHIVEELTRQFNIERTRAASDALRRKDIDQIVDEHISSLLATHPQLRGEHTTIAKTIVMQVTEEVKRLDPPPPGPWAEADLTDPDQMDLAIDRVRQRVRSYFERKNDEDP